MVTNIVKTKYHHGDLKDAIMSAALSDLADHGLESFSLRRVAKAVGVSPAAPSHHFGNAEGLLTDLAIQGFKQLLILQKHRQSKVDADGASQLVASGIGYIDFAVENPTLFQLMFNWRNLDESRGGLTISRKAAYDHLVSNIEAIRHEDGRADKSVMIDVMAAWVTVHGLASLITSGRTNQLTALEGHSEDARAALLARLILKSVQN